MQRIPSFQVNAIIEGVFQHGSIFKSLKHTSGHFGSGVPPPPYSWEGWGGVSDHNMTREGAISVTSNRHFCITQWQAQSN